MCEKQLSVLFVSFHLMREHGMCLPRGGNVCHVTEDEESREPLTRLSHAQPSGHKRHADNAKSDNKVEPSLEVCVTLNCILLRTLVESQIMLVHISLILIVSMLLEVI